MIAFENLNIKFKLTTTNTFNLTNNLIICNLVLKSSLLTKHLLIQKSKRIKKKNIFKIFQKKNYG